MGNPRNRTRKVSRKGKRCKGNESLAKRQRVEGEYSAQATPEVDGRGEPDGPNPSSADGHALSTPLTSRTSASARKLGERFSGQAKKVDSQGGFILLDLAKLKGICYVLCCPECKTSGLTLMEDFGKKKGLSIKFILECSSCFWEMEFDSSSTANIPGKSRNNMEVNVRMVMAMREIGVGYEGLNMFAINMNMHRPMTKNNYNKIIHSLHESFMNVASESMKVAAEDLKSKENTGDIAASFDGSWQKRGHASLNGIVSAISISTGKVLDFEVKSKKCKGCEAHMHLDKSSEEYLSWKLDHNAECSTNHTGSSGQMEVNGTLEMYKRSCEKNGLRYVSFIGDGDSSTYKTVSSSKPYGDEVEIVKKECVGHVQKRLGTRLRKLKTNYGRKKLSDGKSIGGRGRLTDRIIDTMQNYYGCAIRKNKNNLDGMVNDVKAGLFHVASTEVNPQHQFCPTGKESWCGWQKDASNGTNEYKSKHGLDKPIVDTLIPIYDSLSDRSLLSRCLDSYTQNPNESLNNMVWRRCPKNIYQGKKVVELCTASAVASFNDGASSVATVLERLGIKPGHHMENGIRAADQKRIIISEKSATEKAKKQRKRLRAMKKGLWDKNKEKEGIVYESGAF